MYVCVCVGGDDVKTSTVCFYESDGSFENEMTQCTCICYVHVECMYMYTVCVAGYINI